MIQLLIILFIKLQHVHLFIISIIIIIIINIPSLLTALSTEEKRKENNKGNIPKAQYFFCFWTLNLHIHLQWATSTDISTATFLQKNIIFLCKPEATTLYVAKWCILTKEFQTVTHFLIRKYFQFLFWK